MIVSITTNEHIVYGTNKILMHLILLFSALIKHSFVPCDFCFAENEHDEATKFAHK